MTADALVLKHQAISIHNADLVHITLVHYKKKYTLLMRIYRIYIYLKKKTIPNCLWVRKNLMLKIYGINSFVATFVWRGCQWVNYVELALFWKIQRWPLLHLPIVIHGSWLTHCGRVTHKNNFIYLLMKLHGWALTLNLKVTLKVISHYRSTLTLNLKVTLKVISHYRSR